MKLLKIRSGILQVAIQSFSNGLFEQTIQSKGALSLKCSELANIGMVEGFMKTLKKIKSEQIELDKDIETNLNDALSILTETLDETKRLCSINSTSDAPALSQELQRVETNLEGAIVKMKIFLRESTLPPPPPTSHHTRQEEKTNSDVVSKTLKNTQAAVTATKEMLTFRAKEVDKQREAWNNATNAFMKVQGEIMTLDAKIASLEDIIKLLKQALKVLAQLSSQWRKMADFFEMINTMVQTWEEGPQKQFIEIVEKGLENTIKQKKMTDTAKRFMFGYARESAGYAFVINRVSTGYFKISSKFLLIPMASLKELMNIEASNESLIQRKKNELKSQADKAIKEIKRLGGKEFERTKIMLQKKMEDIDKNFNDVLSKIPPKVKQEVIQDTKNTMKEMKYKKTEVSIVQKNLEQFSKIGDDTFLDEDDFLNDIN